MTQARRQRHNQGLRGRDKTTNFNDTDENDASTKYVREGGNESKTFSDAD